MNDGIGLAEALLGLPGFRVLAVTETDCEVVIAGVDGDVGGLPHVWGARRGAGSDAGRCARPGVLGEADAAALDEAAVALPGSRGVRRGHGPRRLSTSTHRSC
jgi:hypothetical protein